MKSLTQLLLLFTWLPPGLFAQSPIDLRQASLEDLMDITVTSVSKREQKLSQTAAAIFVINQEDIRRSGATNIPDLLRMAPGVNVEQIDSNNWAISIRGFNSQFANKVLVLVDGRTVYTPVFSGVLWDQLAQPLDNIERIEVIRGPGATVWGANAVNGVISIITKSSKDTKGGRSTGSVGSHEKAADQLQYGGDVGRNGSYRVFGSYFAVRNAASQTGGTAHDAWQGSHAGFRYDQDLSDRDTLVLQGDAFANQENRSIGLASLNTAANTNIPQIVDAAGGNVLARWTHTLANNSETSLQAYYDSYRRTDYGTPVKVRTFDLDFQHHTAAGNRQDIVWGLGYRVDSSGATPGYPVAFSPTFRSARLFSTFIQDEIRISEALSFTLGSKLEHNGYTGFQIEPSARLAWAPPAGRQTVWVAVSRAIRQPSRLDADIRIDLATFPLNETSVGVVRLNGNPKVKSEVVRDYEIGYRSELSKTVSLDVGTFLSYFHDLVTTEPGAPIVLPGLPTIVQFPETYDSKAHAVSYGGEISLVWMAASRWRINSGYSYLHASIHLDSDSTGQITSNIATDFPRHTFQFRSLLTLPGKFELNQSIHYTARLPGGRIPGHARVDTNITKRIGEALDFSLVGQNLLSPRTLEYGDSFPFIATQAVRSVYAKIVWRF